MALICVAMLARKQCEASNTSPSGLSPNVSIPIGSFVKEHDLGYVFGAETGFVIHRDPDSVRAPDVAFVREGRVQGGLSPQFFPGPPDLAWRCFRLAIPRRKSKRRPKTGCGLAATKCGWLILVTMLSLFEHPEMRDGPR